MLPKAYPRAVSFFLAFPFVSWWKLLCLRKASPLKAKTLPHHSLYLLLSLVDETNVFPLLPPVLCGVRLCIFKGL